MALTKETTKSIVARFGANEADTGNTKVQIALLTERIKQLTTHIKAFPKDSGAKRSLGKGIGARRGLLAYYKKNDLEGYRKLIEEIGIRDYLK